MNRDADRRNNRHRRHHRHRNHHGHVCRNHQIVSAVPLTSCYIRSGSWGYATKRLMCASLAARFGHDQEVFKLGPPAKKERQT